LEDIETPKLLPVWKFDFELIIEAPEQLQYRYLVRGSITTIGIWNFDLEPLHAGSRATTGGSSIG
jgi:hypothetical protein